MSAITRLPLDLTAKALSNRIIGESHTLVKVNHTNNRVIMLNYGALYDEPITLRVYNAQGVALKRDVDYELTYLYRDLSMLTAFGVYGMIVVTNPTVSAKVTVDYRAVGGQFSLSVPELKAVMEQIRANNISTVYEDIVGRPAEFIPDDHTHEWWQVYGMESTIAELKRIEETVGVGEEAIQAAAEAYGVLLINEAQKVVDDFAAAAAAHYNDFNNPHKVTKAQVGLSELFNWPMATNAQAKVRANNNLYLTPGNAYAIIAASYLPQLEAHIQRTDNPHQLTAAQVNAYTKAVINSKLATRLNVTDRAANTAKLGGSTWTEFYNDVRLNMNVAEIKSGIMRTARLGSNGEAVQSNAEYALTGNSAYTQLRTIFDRYGSQAGKVIHIGGYSSGAAALSALNASFSNLTSFPIGTYALGRIGVSVSGLGTGWEINVWQRGASGWVGRTGR